MYDIKTQLNQVFIRDKIVDTQFEDYFVAGAKKSCD